jgi:hypothetical protein
MHDLARIIVNRTDWSLPELAAIYQPDDPLASALALIHYFRGRELPRMGFTRAYIQAIRETAIPEQRVDADARWDAAQARDLLMPYHGNAFGALGAETIFLAATPERCRAMGERVIAYRDRWSEGFFGVVHSIMEVIRALFPLEACADADLIPVFCWLFAKLDVEWPDARRWSETTLGTSGHNWYAHTFPGFWMYGLFFPEFTGAAQFQALMPDYLERELNILFEADGWSKEGSAGYHGFATHGLLFLAHLAELNGVILSEPAKAKLRVIADAGWKLICPDGDYPVFADSVRMTAYQGFHGQDRPEFQPCMALRRMAARFWLPEAKFVANSLQPVWQPPYGSLLVDEGEDVMAAYQRVPAAPPVLPDTCLPQSGLYAMRSDWSPNADYLGLIAGTLGPRVSSHKHADLLSFELYAKGRRLLVDNWYGSVAEERENDEMRMWRVKTEAHNTCTVDGADQVPIVQEFLFGATVAPTVDDWRSAANYCYFSGVHEGYFRLEKPVTAVRRKLFYLRDQYWIMIDRFTALAGQSHRYQMHFHLNAPTTLRPDGAAVTSGDGGNLLILPVPGCDGTPELRPNPWPTPGYENPDWLTYTQDAEGSWTFVTLLVPFTGAVPRVAARQLDLAADGRILDPFEATGLAITFNGREDVYVDQHLQWNLPWEAAGHRGQGRLYHSEI